MCCSVLHCVEVRCGVLQSCMNECPSPKVCCSVLQCVEVRCGVLQSRVNECQSPKVYCSVLQCVEVRCSVLQSRVNECQSPKVCTSVCQFVGVCVAVRYRALQSHRMSANLSKCVAVHCNTLRRNLKILYVYLHRCIYIHIYM